MFEKPECHSEFHKLVMGIDLILLLGSLALTVYDPSPLPGK
jgi:hypothetical protein